MLLLLGLTPKQVSPLRESTTFTRSHGRVCGRANDNNIGYVCDAISTAHVL